MSELKDFLSAFKLGYELELRCVIKDKKEVFKLLEKNIDNCEFSQSVCFIKNTHDKASIRQEKMFMEDNKPCSRTEYMKKKPIEHFMYGNFKINISSEIKIPATPISSPDLTRFKFRASFEIIPEWRLDITLTKSVKDYGTQLLLSIKKSFLDFPHDNTAISIFKSFVKSNQEADSMELECEFTGSKPKVLDLETVMSKIAGLSSGMSIENVAAELNRTIPASASIKQLLNNPSTLDRPRFNNYIKDKSRFFYSAKADGERVLIYLSKTCFGFSANGQKTINIKNPPSEISILDCEAVTIGKSCVYKVFDALKLNNRLITGRKFSDRIQMLNDWFSKTPQVKELNLQLKPHFPCSGLTPDKLVELEKLASIGDGLILTQNDAYFYSEIYKWKPLNQNTIDFYLLDVSEIPEAGIHGFALFSGCKTENFAKYNNPAWCNKLPNWNQMQGDRFSLVLFKAAPFYIPNTEFLKSHAFQELQDCVSEMLYLPNEKKWKWERFRPDRTVFVKQDLGFGNTITVAENNFSIFADPIELKDLVKPSGNLPGYFAQLKGKVYKPLTKFNSWVKFRLLSAIKNANFVIDLAAGKGQDLFTLHGLGVKKLLAIDIDAPALEELIKRSKNLGKRDLYPFEFRPANDFSLQTQKLDLSIATTEQVKEKGANAVVMNFAIHYILKSKSATKDFIAFIKSLLTEKGELVITLFNGEDMAKRFSQNEVRLEENQELKYHVKPVGEIPSELNEFGKEIEVLHPFSAGAYYKEYLVPVKLAMEEMKSQGFTIMRHGNFGDWFADYAANRPKLWKEMSENDKKYSNFYCYIHATL